ncbi:MAG: hypothetical protein U5Q03_00190 [Bacteroidota bacterium]|nr:hypothetical protein [Bacteroidota bacterium]
MSVILLLIEYKMNHPGIKRAFFLLTFTLSVVIAFSQHIEPDTPEVSLRSDVLAFPWAGGMNSCQYGEIDLDDDGLYDLVVFDRTGNRIMPFINIGIPDSIAYQYAPEYAFGFPALFDWVIFRDYDQDGKMDIFTYAKGLAGMLVFRNVSSGGELKFKQMVDPFLTSFQGGDIPISLLPMPIIRASSTWMVMATWIS